ncbi:ribonuclease HII [Priestia endophytica]
MSESIKEIKAKLEKVTSKSDPFLLQCATDERKGVQKLVLQKEKWFEKQEALEEQFLEMMKYENTLYAKGIELIAGIDEVGRGPLAGPVVSAAVILPHDFRALGLTDSKKLSEKKRESYYELILENALAVGVGIIGRKDIDSLNIYHATRKAMESSIRELEKEPDYLLIDAMKLPNVSIPQIDIVSGDAKSISIAAASIVAKVTRDRLMKKLGEEFPAYGFEKHMGYGTKEHLDAIEKHGIIDEHRRSFSPIKEYVES